ncbi:uncharacterized protein EV420DRAFT_1544157 [Desarmillaria tabescens]|uniref:Uncharacterized protein n=1 Tax=Armillaria tabescens TaxID=1929756 RepID=A0AA39N4U9_ARMTA|nr:uncharacterized protein EV420DRAFT_1544157 [Desarmillaria tabescens]KAK0458206.1 hypothetical protein EV420DRAFT_1544157 [Desarmillaria tabescens]
MMVAYIITAMLLCNPYRSHASFIGAVKVYNVVRIQCCTRLVPIVMSGIDSCLKIAKLTAAAGEMAPFPFVKGAAQCVIERASKNKEDMQELAESIVAILVVVRDTTICVEYQTRSPRGIRQYLRATKISDDIGAYRQRVQMAKEDFLVRTMTMTRLALSDVQDEITTRFGTLAERNITSAIKDNIEEMRTWGVRDIIPGDIYVIKPATLSFRSCRAIGYKDSYCTVENSNTLKIIREYQALGDDKEDAIEQLYQALDVFVKQKFAFRTQTLAQIFGVCRSSNLPAIIFHGTTRVPFKQYLYNLTAKRFVQFYPELYQDLQSVSEVFGTTRINPMSMSMAKLYLGNLSYDRYILGFFRLDLSVQMQENRIRLMYGLSQSTVPLHSQISRWMTSSSSRKGELRNHYDAISVSHLRSAIRNPFPLRNHNAPLYLPGSVVTNPPYTPRKPSRPDSPRTQSTLVGRVRPWPHEWEWDVHLKKLGKEVIILSLDNGLVSVGPSFFDGSQYDIEIHVRSRAEIVQSWIAQASKLYSCLRSRGYGDDAEVYIQEGGHLLQLETTADWRTPLDIYFTVDIDLKDKYGRCHLCNLGKDRHALSLSMTAPVIDYRTNTIESLPFVSYFRACDVDSLEEEGIFTVQAHMLQAKWWWQWLKTGADVCEYFGWLLLEILDSSTGEWMLDGTVSEESSRPASVISDKRGQILNEEHNSAPRGTDVVTRSTEAAQAGKAPTKMEIVSAVQYDISTRTVIIIFIAIGIQFVLLSSFQNHL